MTSKLSAILLLGLLIIMGATASLAKNDGGISEKFIDQLQAKPMTQTDKTIGNILANKDIKEFAVNREKMIAHNNHVNHKIKTSDITSQKSSGRCWIFAGVNVLRIQAMKNLKVKDLEFSQNYIHFWDKFEKSNYFLQRMIDLADRPIDDREMEMVMRDNIGDGGWWNYFTALVKKYGLAPKEIMPETHNSSATGRMNGFLKLLVKGFGMELRNMARDGISEKDLSQRKEEMLAETYRLLVLHLGQPPTEFTWRHELADTTVEGTVTETYTPKSFFKAAISDDLDDFVALFNYPGKDLYLNYNMTLSRNMYDEPDLMIVNVPIDTMKMYTMKSILDSMPVWFAMDIGQENYSDKGIMRLGIYDYESILGLEFNLPREDLMHLGLIGSTHAMAFMGVDTVDNFPSKWLVENSWGSKRGDDGKWYLYDDWFDRYMYGVIIHKRYLSKDLLDISKSKPIMLTPWDPMGEVVRENN
ncbi:MAG: C1 family peptidase [candidate division Zixibacteria bacterium]